MARLVNLWYAGLIPLDESPHPAAAYRAVYLCFPQMWRFSMSDARRERWTLIRRYGRGWRSALLVVPAVASLVLLAGGLVANSAPHALAATRTTNVVLTFDDGNANQMAAL